MRSRLRRRLGVLAALVVSALALPLAVAQAQVADGDQIVVRSIDGRNPDAVEVEFLWTGDRDRVTDLVLREEGRVLDASTPVRLVDEAPFGIVLAIDLSGSMEENAAFVRATDAARAFVANKGENDQIAIVGFNDGVLIEQRFTSDEDDLLDAIDRLGVGGGTALYDAVVDSINLFGDTDLVPNVVVVTDGEDADSRASLDVAAGRLADANALLYAVGIESNGLETGPLERLAEPTGGAVFVAEDPADLEAVYGEAQELIRRQYRTTFVSEAETTRPTEVSLGIGTASDVASYTPGARLDSALQVEPVEVPDPTGIEALQSTPFLVVAVILVLLAAAAVVWSVATSLIRDRPALDHVLQPYSDGFVAADDDEHQSMATSAILQRAVSLTGSIAERRGLLPRVEDLLERANLPLRAAEALFFYIVATVLVAVLAIVATGNLLAAVVIVALAVILPVGAVNFLVRRRKKQFEEQLPDMLGLLASTLRSGYSLMQGVEAAAKEVADPMRQELGRVVSEARLGMPLEDALAGVVERTGSRDFEWAVMAIGIQREVGGNLAELLDTVAETMTQRERLRRDINALTAEGRVSAFVLGALPVGLGFMIYTLNPDYISGLWEETVGLVMLVASLFLMAFGFWWMYKIIDIEV